MRTVALVLALTSGGCALAAARSPDLPVRVEREPSCNSGKGAVFADGLGGGLFGLASLGLLAAEEPASGLVLGLAAAAFIGSAVSGSRSADRCRAARDEYQALVAARDEQVAVQRAVVQTERRLRGGGPVEPVADAAGLTATPPGGPVGTTTPPTAKPPTAPPATAIPPAPGRPPAPAPARPPAGPVAADPPDDDPADEPTDDDAADAGARDWAEFWREVKP